MTDYTAIVSGAGPAGLAAAILLAQDGVNTALIGPPAAEDLRTTALMQPSIQLLKFIGIWPGEIAGHCAPLKRLHIVDDTGNLVSAPKIEFVASELGLEEFGFNIPLIHLVPALQHRAQAAGVHFINGKSANAIAQNESITVTTENGANITAKVLLIADGAASPLRRALGFNTQTTRYDQMALVTTFDHSASHDFTSTEFHKEAGPFATVPLPGNRSGLVWMSKPAGIEALLKLSDKELCTEIQLESHGFLGLISNLGSRKSFPMQTSSATVFAKSRAMLVGEAAHALPPIGAQGLNLSLRDVATAADLIIGAGDPGSATITAAYDKQRQADVATRLTMTGLLNASLLSELSSFHLARALGLAAV
ncbi:MAG: FAD-dependent monooxygenase, partial [Aestuariivirga sp.]